jgi:hypothetical protein
MLDDALPHRVKRLEEGVDRLTDTVATQGRQFDSKLDSIGQSISLLVRIDERQVAIAERLQMGAATMQKHEDRLSKMEMAMPGLQELRRYVVAGIVAGAGMLAVALLKLVMFA